MLLEVSVALFAVYLISFVIQTWLELKKLPHGPIPLPIIGNMHQLGTSPPFSMSELCDKYPNVLRVKTPLGYIVFLNSVEAAREALLTRKTDMAGRPKEIFNSINDILQHRDISSADFGPAFSFRSSIFKNAIHTFGEGGENIEKRLHRAVRNLLNILDERLSEPLVLKKIYGPTIMIQLWEWVSSDQLVHEDAKAHKIAKFINLCMTTSQQGTFYQFVPLLRYLPTEHQRKINEAIKIRTELFGKEFDNHKKTYQNGVVRDLIDAMLLAFDNKEKKGGKLIGSSDDIAFLLLDVLLGGSDSTSSLLQWCILYVAVKQDVQRKIQEELDKHMEKDTLPNAACLKKLDYLHAVICEVMRVSILVPLIPHRAIRDTSVMGQPIPSNTMVFLNMLGIHRDPKAWDKPNVFDPSRFLDEHGKFIGWNKQPGFMPFLLGRRACPGQEIGKIYVLTILSSLLQRYNLRADENQPCPDLNDAVCTAMRCPRDYKVVLTRRA